MKIIPFTPSRLVPRGHLVAFLGLLTLCVTPARAADSPVIVPDKPIMLFNGKDLTGFYTWTAEFGRLDPNRVFTVVDQVDGAPAIRSSGQNYGGIITNERYANYRLLVEFRWGTITWGRRANRTLDSGILLHCQGEDGNSSPLFRGPWPSSVEFQIIEGGTGDVILVNGFIPGKSEKLVPKMTFTVQPGKTVWDPKGVPTEFNKGRIDWWGRDPGWKDELGFRGARDVEKPAGQWNALEAIVDGGNIVYFVNGVKVMEGTNGSYKDGRLLFQSEGAEIFFRKIELHPLKR
ncbi:MAG: hypothetical protein RIQ93_68 [Verrucomicrobiota bacterium]